MFSSILNLGLCFLNINWLSYSIRAPFGTGSYIGIVSRALGGDEPGYLLELMDASLF